MKLDENTSNAILIITQAYRSRCGSETHQVRPKSLKTFRIVQQGEVSFLRVAYF